MLEQFRGPDSSDKRARSLVDYALAQTERVAKCDGDSCLPLDSFPGYQLGRLIQRGGQGLVFRAVQLSTGKTVALKVLRHGTLASSRERIRFGRETRILVELNHPNIVGISDSGTAAGHNYFVMDYVEGRPLDEFVRAGDLSVHEVLRLFSIVCQAVHAAHEKGIVHRDLKPSNIRVTAQGIPKVLDFGMATMLDRLDPAIESKTVTETGQFVGSLPWAAPEQVRGDWDDVDASTDVYSLGVILYQLLTGEFPYPVTGSMATVLKSIEEAEPERLRNHISRVDGELETMVLKCLQKQRERRYSDAGAVAKDLRQYLSGDPIDAKRDSTWYLMTKKLRRYRALVIGSLLLALVGIGSSLVFAVLYNQRLRAERDAQNRTREVEAMDAFLGSMLASVRSRSDADSLKFVELLSRSEEYITGNLGNQPLVEASLRVKLGESYGRLWMHAEAERHLETALAIRRRELGDTAQPTAEAMGRLALRYKASEKLDQAESLFRESLAVQFVTLPPDHPDVVWKKMYLADVLEKMRRFDEADALYREALDSFSRQPGEEYANYFNAANNYLVFLTDTNRIPQAEQLARTAVLLLEENAGTTHNRTEHMRANLARVLIRQGDLRGARDTYERLLDDHARAHGENDATLGSQMYRINLAEVLLDQNELQKAEALLRETLEFQRREVGDEERTVLLIKRNLADVLSRQGAHEQANALAREVLDATDRVLGSGGGEFAEARVVLGQVLLAQGQDEAAEPLLIKGVDDLVTIFGLGDRASLEGLEQLGLLYMLRGKPALAEPLLRRAVGGAESAFPESHWLRGAARARLGACLLSRHEFREAEDQLSRAITTLEGSLGPGHPRTRRAMEDLALLYDATERHEEAEQCRAAIPH